MRFVIYCLLILICSSCALFPSAPKWPKHVNKNYSVVVIEKEAFCFSYDIQSVEPYVLGEPVEEPLEKCDGVTGFLPKDMKDVLTYKSKAEKWIGENCKEKSVATVQTEESLGN